MKKIGLFMLVAVLVCSCLISCDEIVGSTKDEEAEAFYDIVSESQTLLDIVADDIYSNWYDAIYEDEFDEDIDVAIAYAFVTNEANVEVIEANDEQIKKLFQKAKEGEYSQQVKDVMSAYSDYYEFVINVSGSFNSFSAEKETLKKELASALRDLYYEL